MFDSCWVQHMLKSKAQQSNKILLFKEKFLIFKEKIKCVKGHSLELCFPRAPKARASSCSLHLRNIEFYVFESQIILKCFPAEESSIQACSSSTSIKKVSKPRNTMKIYPELITLPTTQTGALFCITKVEEEKISVDVILCLCFLLKQVQTS